MIAADPRLAILGLSTAVPPFQMSQVQAAEMATQIATGANQDTRRLAALYRRSNIDTRHTVVPHQLALEWAQPGEDHPEGEPVYGPTTGERMRLYAEGASPLAVSAAAGALNDAGVEPETITHLVPVTCTGFAAPGVDLALIETLGLSHEVQRVQVGFMGCHGAINGLRAAGAFVGADHTARVLVCAVELCSLHYSFVPETSRIVGNMIFADGAAAMVLGVSSKLDAWRLAGTGSCFIPDSADAIQWAIGDHGFEMILSSRVPELINEHLRPWMSRWLSKWNLKIEDVQSWAVHPGGPRILNAVDAALELPLGATDVSRAVLRECGNMSSPTTLFIVERLRQADAPRPCVALGFGPGLVAEAALFV